MLAEKKHVVFNCENVIYSYEFESDETTLFHYVAFTSFHFFVVINRSKWILNETTGLSAFVQDSISVVFRQRVYLNDTSSSTD